MAENHKLSTNTAKHRIHVLGIKPVSKDALYTEDDNIAVGNVSRPGNPHRDKPDKRKK